MIRFAIIPFIQVHCFLAAVGLAAACCTAMAQDTASSRNLVVAYVPNWVDLKSFADTIDYSKLTHINMAFENPVNDAGDLSFLADNDAVIAKAHASKLKILVSLGGGSASE